MELFTEKKEIKEGESTLVRLSLSLPKAKNARRFNAYYGSLKDAFLHYAATDLKKEAAKMQKPIGAALDTVVSTEREGLVSLYVDAIIGGETTRRHRISATWNKKRDVILPCSAIFEGKPKRLLPLLVNAATARAESAAVPLYPDFEKRIKKLFDKNSFYISPRSTVFYYQSGSLSPKNAPFPLSISIGEIFPFVKKSVAPLLWEL